MSQLTEDLDRLIQKAALDGALTQKAVDMFHTVLKENEDIRKDLEKQNKDLGRMQKERDELNTSFNQTSTQLSDYQTRERELVERETKITRLEIERNCADLRVKDHVHMVELIFRNLEVRRNVFPVSPSTHVTESGMHGMGGMIEEREQTEKTE